MIDHSNSSSSLSSISEKDSGFVDFEKFMNPMLETCFRRELGEDWTFLVDGTPPFKTYHILRLLIKHWISVFGFLLPKSVQRMAEEAFEIVKKQPRNRNAKAAPSERLAELMKNIRISFQCINLK